MRSLCVVFLFLISISPSFSFTYPAIDDYIEYEWSPATIRDVKFNLTWRLHVTRPAGEEQDVSVSMDFKCQTSGSGADIDFQNCRCRLSGGFLSPAVFDFGTKDFRPGYSMSAVIDNVFPDTYSFVVTVQCFSDIRNFTYNVKISGDSSGYGSPGYTLPDPNDPLVTNWWDWLRNLFTMSSSTRTAYDAARDRLRNAGPFGVVNSINSRVSATSAYGPLRASGVWREHTIWGVRRVPGGPAGVEPLVNVPDCPLPLLGNQVILPLSNGGPPGTPWYNPADSFDVDDLVSGARTVMAAGIWVFAGIALIGWVKGHVGV